MYFTCVQLFVVCSLIHTIICPTAAPGTKKCVKEYADILFLVDSSSSVVDNDPPGDAVDNWSHIKNFLSEVIQLLPIDTGEARVGVVTFSTKVNLNNDSVLHSNVKSIINVVANLPFSGGNTNTSGALKYARYILLNTTSPLLTSPPSISSSNNIKKIIVLITDGLSNVDSSLTLQEARLNKQLSIEQYAIGITKYTNEDELQDLVSDPVSYYYLNASDFSHLNLLINELLQRLTCSQPPLPEPCRDTRSDIAFVLDSSGSIIIEYQNGTRDLSNWALMKKFVINLAKNLNIGLNQTRLSLITFSQIARVEFYLKDFTDIDSIVANISKIDIIGSETNTSGALRLMNDDVFKSKNGDRPDIPNVAIVMTDGQSNVNESGTIPESMRAKNLGVRMFVIGLTNEINVQELQAMSSLPLDQHYFNRTTYALVDTLLSNLVWNVCHGTCIDNNTGACRAGSLIRCLPNEQLKWTMYPGSLIIGHDYARLTDILTADSCKTICLQDPLCRSIEFIPLYQECSVSYYRKADVIQSFRKDPEVNYYEWICS